MSDPRTSPAEVFVEFQYLVVGGDTCDRCTDTHLAVHAALDDAARPLGTAGIALRYTESELGADRIHESNRVLVNGRPAEQWLGGSEVLTDCPSCTDLVGFDVRCREIELDGVRTVATDRDVILDAIMAAAGLAPEGVPGAACTGGGHHALLFPPDERPWHPSPLVTLVSGTGCT